MQTRGLHGKMAGLAFGTLVALASACGGSATTATVADDVWATVGDREIRRDLVEKAYRGMVQPEATPPSDEEILTVKLGIVDELINQEILLARASALGVAVTDAEVDAELAQRKTSVSEAEFALQLGQRGLTTDDIRQGIRRELSVQKVIDQEVISKIGVTDEDIAAFYNQNRDQFNVTETQYRLAQIIITPVRDPQLRNRLNDDAGSAADARRKADMLTERLKAGGEFGQLAMDYSEDPQTVAQGGDLGFIPESALNQVPPALRDAVRKMEPGGVTTLEAGGNYTILMLVSREEPGQRDLGNASVRDGIREMLRDRREQLLRSAYITAARNDARVTNHLARRAVEAQGRLPTAARQ